MNSPVCAKARTAGLGQFDLSKLHEPSVSCAFHLACVLGLSCPSTCISANAAEAMFELDASQVAQGTFKELSEKNKPCNSER